MIAEKQPIFYEIFFKKEVEKMCLFDNSIKNGIALSISHFYIFINYLFTTLGESPVDITSVAAFSAPSTRFLTAVSV